MSRSEGELVGRFISEPFADGKAYYKIVKENKNTVRIKVCRGLGDDNWVIPYWGEETSIKKDFALQKLRQRDALRKIFSKKEIL